MRGRKLSALALTIAVALSGCAWTHRYGDAGRSGHNPYGGLDADGVSTLREVWRTSSPISYEVLVDGDYVFGTRNRGDLGPARVEAYPVAGDARCSGAPRVCPPLWVTRFPGTPTPSYELGHPILVEGFLVVPYGDGTDFSVALFDRRGLTNCDNATPRSCTPVGRARLFAERSPDGPPSVVAGDDSIFAVSWISEGTAPIVGIDVADIVGCSGGSACAPFMRATTDALNHAPAYAGGRLYVRSSIGIAVYDGSGTRSCVGGTCTPMWSYRSAEPALTEVHVAHGRVVESDHGRVAAFDAAGTSNCGGAPRVCDPLWQSDPSHALNAFSDAVVVTGDVVLAAGDTAAGGSVNAYDLAGSRRCAGVPNACAPLWRVAVPGLSTPANILGAGSVGVAGGGGGGASASTLVFRLDGSGCDATTSACEPIRTFPTEYAFPTAVAGGRLLVLTSLYLRVLESTE